MLSQSAIKVLNLIVAANNSIPVNASFNLFTASNCDSSDVLVTFNGTGGINYLWDFGDGTTGSGISTNHHYSQAGNYIITLLVKDSICSFSDSVSQEVIVRPSVRALINTNQVLFGCAPQTIRFSNAFPSTGNYLWDLGDNTYSNLKIVEHDYIYPGFYTISLTVSDSASCNMEDKAVYNLKVYEKPKAGFTFIQNNHSLYTEVDFFNNSSVNSAFYLWDFADSTFESSAGPVNHKYYKRGNYNVCLNVTTIEGCADISCENLIVENEETIYIPSSFSPNGDGKNDFFKIYFTGLLELEIIIYDRWGVKLFESNTLDGSWDGSYNGEPVLQDIYVYKLTAKGLINDHIERTGKITVIY